MPCSHPACSKFCIHLKFLPEIVCKVEKLRSTFHTFHDYLNFCGEKKMTGYLLFTYHQAFSLFLSSFLRLYLPILQHLRNSQIDNANHNIPLQCYSFLSFHELLFKSCSPTEGNNLIFCNHALQFQYYFKIIEYFFCKIFIFIKTSNMFIRFQQ